MNSNAEKGILVVAEPVLAATTAATLENYGFNVTTVGGGEQAVAIVEGSAAIDLILLSDSLDGSMDGAQTARMLLAACNLPLILLASGDGPETIGKMTGIPAYGYVAKDSGSTALIASVESALALCEHQSHLRQAEAALHTSEMRWHTLVQNLPFYIAEAAPDGRILALNHVQPGFSFADYVGKSLFDVVAPDSRAQFQAAFARVLEEGSPIAYEAPGYGPNRAPAWYYRQLVPITQDGEIRSVLMVAEDITLRRQAEEALRASEEKWRSIFEILPVGVSVVDVHNQVLEVNPALSEILELSQAALFKAEYQKRRYLRSDGTPMAAEEFPSIRALSERSVIRDIEIGIEKEDGGMIWTSVSSTPLAHGTMTATVTIDITERKLAQAEQEMLIGELQTALQRVKQLSGLLPICANCKKIRDDEGNWQDVAVYIHNHSEADFSHSICPDCMAILYPELVNVHRKNRT